MLFDWCTEVLSGQVRIRTWPLNTTVHRDAHCGVHIAGWHAAKTRCLSKTTTCYNYNTGCHRMKSFCTCCLRCVTLACHQLVSVVAWPVDQSGPALATKARGWNNFWDHKYLQITLRWQVTTSGCAITPNVVLWYILIQYEAMLSINWCFMTQIYVLYVVLIS